MNVFSIVVISVTKMLDGSGYVVTGNLHGTVKIGDELYDIKPNNEFSKATITGLESISPEGVSSPATEATNCSVSVSLNMAPDAKNVGQLDVLTNIEPMEKMEPGVKVENPMAAGLLYELPRLNKNQTYNSVLTYALTHAYFITPLKLDGEPVDNGDGTETFEKQTKMGFYMLPSGRKDASVETGENCFLLPVFTDWRALGDWKQLRETSKKVRTMVLKFPDAVAITKNPNFAGFVVNPFSQNQTIIDKKLIETITNMDGYKKDFPQESPTVPMQFVAAKDENN
ncbi:MAG: SseB family protein [Pseudobutyrivibrio sp.]|nr:SseB family protein [Pseudobutyrivibrio sp.]